MSKKNEETDFSVEESPAGSKVVSIAKGRKKFNLRHVVSQAKKVIGFGKAFHIYLYLSIFGVFASTFFDLIMPVFLGKAIDCITTIGDGAKYFIFDIICLAKRNFYIYG